MAAFHSTSSAADCNLLFGILALQMDFISRDALIEAMNAWVLDKTKPLSRILLEHKHLNPDYLQVLQAVVAKHLEAHSNDAQQSLASLSAMPGVERELREIADDDVQASLSRANPAEITRDHGTVDFSTSRETSDGQRYRILRPHAKGGLGEVFVAEDEELHREVAVKEIRKEHANDDYSRGRFVLEAEITGGLEHPGIVPVYGLGQYDDGRPFYAMRLVRGDDLKQSIKRFHSERRGLSASASGTQRNMEFRQLLGRFVDVCNAIAYAHSRGILHRDLKPGNVMLGKYGETMIVDWGLAKPVDRQESFTDVEEVTLRPTSAESSMAATRMGSAIGTPAFMSPEQAAGRLDQLGPASDIYSLGATLYTLLTGEVAFSGGAATILSKVQKGDFAPPRQVRPDVPRPLEAICLKAMARHAHDRYDSALELSEDIEHWLADEPVGAWPEPLKVKTARWVRKHKPLVASAAAALLVGLLALAGGAFWQQQERARRAAQIVQTEQEIRDALNQAQELQKKLHDELTQPGGVFRLLDDPSRWEGHIKQAKEVLERAKTLQSGLEGEVDLQLTKKIQALQAALSKDEADRKLAARLEEVRQDRYVITEHDYDYGKAAREYPKVFRDANLDAQKESAQRIAGLIRQSPIKEQLVTALDDWAYGARYHAKDKKLMKRLLKVASLADPDPWKNQVRDPATWENPKQLKKLMDQAPVDKLPPQMLVVFGWMVNKNKLDRESWWRKAHALHPTDYWINVNLAVVLRRARPREAEGFYRAALVARPRGVAAYHNLGYVLSLQGKTAEADAMYKKAIALQPDFARLYVNLGYVLANQNKTEEAINAYRKAYELAPTNKFSLWALASSQRLEKNYPAAIATLRKVIKAHPKYASAHSTLGIALRASGKRDEAIAAFKEAIEAKPSYYWGHNHLAYSYYAKKDYHTAIKYARKASKIDPNKSSPYHIIAKSLRAQKDYRGAMEAYTNAADTRPLDPNSYFTLGTNLRRIRYSTSAIAAFKKAIKLNPKFADAYTNLGAILVDRDDLAGALDALKKAIELDPKSDAGYNNLGVVYLKQKKLHAAESAYQNAIKLNPKLVDAYLNLIAALNLQKDFLEAANTRAKLLALEFKSAVPYYSLGNKLADRKDLDGAVISYRKAIALDPEYPEANCNLGHRLRELGDFAAALKYMKRGHELGVKKPGWRYSSDKWLKRCELLLKQDQKWQAARRQQADLKNAAPAHQIVQGLLAKSLSPAAGPMGMAAPFVVSCRFAQSDAFAFRKKAVELLNLASFCFIDKKQYRSAFQYYRAAFEIEPKRADDTRFSDRVYAARSAVLAAAGKGNDAKPGESEQAELREQALRWLKDDLAMWNKRVQYGKVTVVVSVGEWGLRGWQTTPDMASVRDAEELTKLPTKEQHAWRQFWADVEKLQRHARSKYAKIDIKGALTSKNAAAIYPMIMDASKTYHIDLKSRQFDPYLSIENDKGKTLAQNDDVSSVDLDSRIVFRPGKSGTYNIVASPYKRGGEGSYYLSVREFPDPAKNASITALHHIKGNLIESDPKDTFVRTRNSYRKVYAVELQADKTYQVDLTAAFDTFLRVEDSRSRHLFFNDDNLPAKDLNSRLIFTPKFKDTFRFVVTSFAPGSTGPFSLAIRELVKQGKPLAVNGTLTKKDRALFGSYYKDHKIPLLASRYYSVVLKSGQFDTFLILSDPTGKRRLAQNDDASRSNKNLSRIDFVAPRSAAYVFRVTSGRAGGTGAYTLSVQPYGLAKYGNEDKK